MKEDVAGIERALRAMGSWNPDALAYIERLDFEAEGGRVTLVGLLQPRGGSPWPDIDGEFHRVKLRFWGVRGLELKGFGSGGVQIMGFEIVSIRDRGLEGACLEVGDYEDGSLKFTCERAEILDVSDKPIRIP